MQFEAAETNCKQPSDGRSIQMSSSTETRRTTNWWDSAKQYVTRPKAAPAVKETTLESPFPKPSTFSKLLERLLRKSDTNNEHTTKFTHQRDRWRTGSSWWRHFWTKCKQCRGLQAGKFWLSSFQEKQNQPFMKCVDGDRSTLAPFFGSRSKNA